MNSNINENKVTVFQSPLLARALYFTGEIGKEISENLYSAVASVLAYIFKIERGEETDYPEFEIPENMNFDDVPVPDSPPDDFPNEPVSDGSFSQPNKNSTKQSKKK